MQLPGAAVVLSLFLAGASAATGRILLQEQGNWTTCACTREYRPVCKNGKTYNNPCLAACDGHRYVVEGACSSKGRASTPQQPITTAPVLPACPCTREYNPQCGVDGKTYANPCVLKCAGVKLASEGACKPGCPKKDCICTAQYAPVCGKDGKTYGNACTAACACAEVASQGECPAKPASLSPPAGCEPNNMCICTLEYRPVCGVNGKTYGNRCGADCECVAVQHEGECKPASPPPKKDCPACPGFCTADYRPQCGVDGKTYGNLCALNCACVKLAYEGECKKASASANITAATATPPKKDCPACPGFCTLDYRPQCGADGKTYGNLCALNCACVKLAYEGECKKASPPPCKCTKELVPVCSDDGKTYSNGCLAACAGVQVASQGACKPSCICPMVYIPVCGVDGKTYPNQCHAACAGVAVARDGACSERRLCKCSAVLKPVCGSDFKTYINDCMATCSAGVQVVNQGPCLPKVCTGCSHEYKPVCAGGQEFTNACEAKCAGQTKYSEGKCKVCACPKILKPVCADGRTYGNQCLAKCVGASRIKQGACAMPAAAVLTASRG